MSGKQQDPRCAHCGRALTADESEFYGTGCGACETELHHAMQDDRAPVLPPPPSEVEQLRAENRVLRKALEPFAHAAGFWEIESQTDEGQQILVKPGEGFSSALTVRAFRDARRAIRREKLS